MNIHKNARMTVHGRALLVSRICDERWRVADAAGAAGVSKRVAYKWLARYRTGGAAALNDRKLAYQTSAERTQAMIPWIAAYNHSRPHSALAGQPPASRLNNVLGFDS